MSKLQEMSRSELRIEHVEVAVLSNAYQELVNFCQMHSTLLSSNCRNPPLSSRKWPTCRVGHWSLLDVEAF